MMNLTVDMQGLLKLAYLPGLVKFIRDHYFREYAQDTLTLARKMDLPLLRHFAHLPDEQMIEIGIAGAQDFFDAIINGSVVDYIAQSNQKWLDNQLPIVSKHAVEIDDPGLLSYVRKRVMAKYIRLYTQDSDEQFELVSEVDRLLLSVNNAAHQTYVSILRNKIDAELHFNEKVTNTSPGVIYVFDLHQQKQIYSNNKLSQLLGYTVDEMAKFGSNYLPGIIHPDDKLIATQRVQHLQTLKPSEIDYWEYRMLHKDGSYRWIRNYESIFRTDSSGVPIQVIGIGLDITHSKEVEEELLSREAELQETQRIAGLGSYEWVIGTKEIKASAEFWKIFDWDKKGAMDLRNKIHPADRQRVEHSIAASAAEGRAFDCEYRIKTASGEKIVWSRGRLIEKDGRKTLKGSIIDMTERNHLLDQLKRSDFLYKQAEAMSHIGNWRWEFASNTLEWSDEMYSIYGIEKSEALIVQETTSRSHYLEDEDMIRAKVQEAINQNQSTEFNYRIITPSGQHKTVQARCEVEYDSSGNQLALFGTVQDVTELLASERKLDELNKQLQRSNDYLQEFAYVASHDLKEPLRKVATFGDMLLSMERETLSESGTMYLERMIRAVDRMQVMIDDLLSLSRISANQQFELVSLKEILYDTLQTLDHKIEEKGAVIKSTELPVIPAIASQFRQLFQNLISNSIKFARTDVPLVINISHHYLSNGERNQYDLPKDRANVKLQFSDNGIGFDNVYSERIFQIFQRLHGKSEYEGSGIGLAICKKIVEHHHGIITASSTIGTGAVFTIIVPAG